MQLEEQGICRWSGLIWFKLCPRSRNVGLASRIKEFAGPDQVNDNRSDFKQHKQDQKVDREQSDHFQDLCYLPLSIQCLGFRS